MSKKSANSIKTHVLIVHGGILKNAVRVYLYDGTDDIQYHFDNLIEDQFTINCFAGHMEIPKLDVEEVNEIYENEIKPKCNPLNKYLINSKSDVMKLFREVFKHKANKDLKHSDYVAPPKKPKSEGKEKEEGSGDEAENENSDTAKATEEPPKKGKGRPKKEDAVAEPVEPIASAVSENNKKKQPKKDTVAEVAEAKQEKVETVKDKDKDKKKGKGKEKEKEKVEETKTETPAVSKTAPAKAKNPPKKPIPVTVVAEDTDTDDEVDNSKPVVTIGHKKPISKDTDSSDSDSN